MSFSWRKKQKYTKTAGHMRCITDIAHFIDSLILCIAKDKVKNVQQGSSQNI